MSAFIAPAAVTFETICVIDYNEIERLAREILGFGEYYNVVVASNFENDTLVTIPLNEKDWMNPEFDDRLRMKAKLAGQAEPDWEPDAYYVLSELAERGVGGITWRTYTVRISW